MGKGIGHIYKHNKKNWTHPYPNTIFVVPPFSVLSPQCDITDDSSATVFVHNQPSPVSNLTTTHQFNNYVNNNDDKQYFETPIKHNINTPEINDINNTTNTV